MNLSLISRCRHIVTKIHRNLVVCVKILRKVITNLSSGDNNKAKAPECVPFCEHFLSCLFSCGSKNSEKDLNG